MADLMISKITLDGKGMKELKKIVKGHRKNRHQDILNYLRIEVLNNSQIEATYIKVNNLGDEFVLVKTIDIVESSASEKTSFLIPIKQIKGLTGIKNDSRYSFKIGSDMTVFRNNSVDLKFVTPNVKLYPKLPNINKTAERGKLTQNDYQHLRNANNYTAELETRPVLRNMLIRQGYIITTDSFRLYKAKTEQLNNDKDILLHKELVDMIIENEEKKSFDITLKADEKNYYNIAEGNKTKYIFKTNSSNYPEIERLIPSDFNQVFTLQVTKHLKDTIARVTKITKNIENNFMTILFNETDQLEIIARGSEGEKLSATFQIEPNHVEKGFRIHMNSSYLQDVLKTFKNGEEVKFNIVDHLKPFTIHKVDNEKNLTLLLPLKLY